VDSRYVAVQGGYYHTIRLPAAANELPEPVINLGPDADSFRDPVDGSIKDASSWG